MTLSEAIIKTQRFERRWLQHLALTLRNNKRYIIQLQRDQLLAGQDKDGKPLRPTYQEDPFFKTAKDMEAYVKVKKKREAFHEGLKTRDFGKKSPDTPNLIYRGKGKGYFQGMLHAEINKTDISIHSRWSRAKKVEAKFPTALGLQPRTFKIIWEDIAKQEILDYWYNMK